MCKIRRASAKVVSEDGTRVIAKDSNGFFVGLVNNKLELLKAKHRLSKKQAKILANRYFNLKD